ncbi:DUF6502 family protein [Natronospira bacteriovora]|uniref:DUF6502 family protein n=1 Tax=Natronospira bacteriovora TaxID=3069753 RepID=A0ABU0W4B7_9GAMM|nr:DUF6502 family protein [Natronospira sp. AB-CW4]MDQ2068862.1 DUF6502 family protein [Natronospira sp. AB-CW4]
MTDNGNLARALATFLRPLARLLLRNGMSYKAFAELAKRVFVEVARDEFRIPGRKQSDSRVSVITGLSRKEVKRVQSDAAHQPDSELRLHNRAARVIHGWVNDPDFQDRTGEPDRLPMENGGRSFTALVRRYSGDAPPRAVLDELDRVHAVERHDDGRLSLIARDYRPPADVSPEKLDYLAEAMAGLISSVDGHWQNGELTHFQGHAAVTLSSEELAEFRSRARIEGVELLDKAKAWLPATSQAAGKEKYTAGIVLYTYEK